MQSSLQKTMRLHSHWGNSRRWPGYTNWMGKFMLLGVGFGNNTSFHLSEIRARGSNNEIQGAPINVNGVRQWVEYQDQAYDSDIFEQIGEDFQRTGSVKRSQVGICHGADYLNSAPLSILRINWLEGKRGMIPPVTLR